MEEIRRIVTTNPKVVAVGETGLDYDRMYSKKENQLHFFKALIAMAEELGKPMFLHERDAADDFLACFKGHEGLCPQSVVHCYTGDKKTLEKMLDLGFILVLPAGSAMNGGRLPYAMLYPSCPWNGSSSKRMHRT